MQRATAAAGAATNHPTTNGPYYPSTHLMSPNHSSRFWAREAFVLERQSDTNQALDQVQIPATAQAQAKECAVKKATHGYHNETAGGWVVVWVESDMSSWRGIGTLLCFNFDPHTDAAAAFILATLQHPNHRTQPPSFFA